MSHTLIIAEAGVNHNGDLGNAKKLIDVAKEAGADIVKFQTFKASLIAGKSAGKADYQKATTNAEEGQVAMLKRLELSEEDHHELLSYAHKQDIQFLSTPFDLPSIDLLKELGITIGKIPSGELTNLPYLRKMAGTFDQLILSTGMATMEEVEEATQVLLKSGLDKRNLTILHCNTEYPTPMQDVNLRAMRAMKDKLGVEVGYSDHTKGIEVSIAAVALGATVIEKHFTLDRTMEGPDHKASLEPDELKAMVSAIRNIEQALGSGIKQTTDSERKNIVIARKSIIAAKEIKQGDVFTDENITVKRPGNGISPMKWDEVLGQKAKRDFLEDELIEL